MSDSPLRQAVAVSRALGHSARLRTVAMLRSGDLCVCQVTEVLKLAPSTVSLHLKELKRAGVITEDKEGRWVHIRLSKDPEVRPWIETTLATVVGDRQIEADDRTVAELRRLPVEDLCRLGYEKARAKQARSNSKRGVQKPRIPSRRQNR